MKSSPDPLQEKTAGAKPRVKLPSFEEMMRVTQLPEEEIGAAALEEGGISKEERAAKSELEKTKELCANMRREALSEADKMINQALQEAVAIRDKARRETVAELRKEADENSAAAKAAIQKAVRAFSDAQDALYDELEPYFLDIALHISESILQYELLRDESAYLSIIRNALSMYRSDGKERTLYLPPKAYAMLVGEDGSGPFIQQMQDVGLRIEIDKRMAEGDCMVESPTGGVRAGVATQLSRIRYAASPEKVE